MKMGVCASCAAEKKPLLALGELLIDMIPGEEGMRIEDAGPVIKTASGSAGITACAMALLGGNGGFIGKVGHPHPPGRGYVPCGRV